MNQADFAGWQPEKTIQVLQRDGLTRVFVKGHPYMSCQSGDEECVRLAIVQLYECGLATQEDLAQAFGRHVNSVQTYIRDFACEGMRGLMSERRGPKGRWKITPGLRGKILLVVLKEGIWKVEAIKQRLAEVWQEVVSAPSIQQVLADNGLGEQTAKEIDGGVLQSELFNFYLEQEQQLYLAWERDGDRPGQEEVGRSETESTERENGIGTGDLAGSAAAAGDSTIGSRRNYSRAQRVYLDQLEQGDYNAYAGGLLFMLLLERFKLLPTLRKVITIPSYEGYSLEELALTLFYLDVFEFRSMEDFKRAYPEEFGVLMGRAQSPSLFTLRRFLHKVRKFAKSEELIEAFGVSYLKSGLKAWGGDVH